jgi:maltose alpha-D-glucosyltransferase/alpha-amylase
VRLRSFFDTDGDGIGEFRGLTEKLDYLHDLGVTALWLLPFYPSPQRDDGYDISDYTSIDPAAGTMRDFKRFLREAHRRGLRVVTELVINHTSDQHPWFQRARRSPPGSRARRFYVWSDTENRYRGTRIIFQDSERSNWTWDPVANAFFWHRFYSHQPDLNFESADVQREIFRILDFWLDLGVDGLRLDAIPYLFEREGTTCENLPETHEFLRRLRRHVDERYRDRMLLAEANQWPEDAVQYFGDGDECHMAFHFPIMPRLFMALHQEDRYPILDILEQTPDLPESCQWALFLRNHDELTLEMVTDEERDYMYRVYAHDQAARINLGIRRRLAPLLGNDRRRIELMNALLFSLPGTPVIYYGDEIGMGDNFYLGDRNGVRTPMQWSPDRNAGFSRANPQQLYLPIVSDPEYNYESINVEAQRNNRHSLLWFMKRLIGLRKQHRAFGRGRIEFLTPSNRKVLAFLRRHENDHLMVVANLSRFVQYVELALPAYKGWTVTELFGGTSMPPIGDQPYLLTLGPHSFYWFTLGEPRAERALAAVSEPAPAPPLVVQGTWENLLRPDMLPMLEQRLLAYLPACGWFDGRGQTLRAVRVVEAIPLNGTPATGVLTIVQADFGDGSSDAYLLPLSCASGAEAFQLQQVSPQSVIAPLHLKKKGVPVEGVLIDAIEDVRFGSVLLAMILRRRSWRGGSGELVADSTRVLREIVHGEEATLAPVLLRTPQRNHCIRFGNQLLLKLYRRLQPGLNPDIEIVRFLSDQAAHAHTPQLAGSIDYQPTKGPAANVAMLQAYVPNQGNAWSYTLDELQRFIDQAITLSVDLPEPPQSIMRLARSKPPPLARELLGAQLETARLIGRCTADLHLKLASNLDDPDFSPEPLTTLVQRSMYQSMRNLKATVFQQARDRMHGLPKDVAELLRRVLALEPKVLKVFHRILERKLSAARIRCHGDYHLGQLLYTGKDFVVIDFEGDPMRPFSERRRKRMALQDVAAMLRSFDYAAAIVLAQRAVPGADLNVLEHWLKVWRAWASSAFLKAYFKACGEAVFLPPTPAETDRLLGVFLLEKAVHELGYELQKRPDWVSIPLRAILSLTEE